MKGTRKMPQPGAVFMDYPGSLRVPLSAVETQLLPGVNQKLLTDATWNWTCGAGLLVWRSGWLLIVTIEDWSWESLLSDLCPFRNGAQNVQNLSLLIKGMGIMMLALQWRAKEMVDVNGFCGAWSCPQVSETYTFILNIEVAAVAGMLSNAVS